MNCQKAAYPTFSLTTPKDACVLSLVASSFLSAAQSDVAWDRFLPSDILSIIGRSNKGPDFLRSFASKKELYLYLCDNPILIDGDKKSFSLDKWSGKKCFMLSASDIHIVWGDTPDYWQWISLPESRFSEVAELQLVWWLEITGKIRADMLSPGTTYAAYLVFTSKAGLDGFEYPLAEGSVGVSGIGCKTYPVCLDPDGARREAREIIQNWNRRSEYVGLREQHLRILDKGAAHCPKQRIDGWMEVELGQIFVKGGEDIELEMSLREVKGGTVKRGLVVEGIEIRPKHI